MLTSSSRGNHGTRSAKGTALLAPPDQTITLPLCTSCRERPRLGTLTRCRSCLIADAQREREQREALQAKLAPATKACRTCKIGKPLGAFGKHRLAKDGHRHDCKVCVSDGRAAKKKRYRQVNRIAVALWAERNPQAARARGRLRRAVRAGDVAPADVCQAQGCTVRDGLVAHHPSYAKPLEVLWLCRSHHRRAHTAGMIIAKADVPRRLTRVPRTK